MTSNGLLNKWEAFSLSAESVSGLVWSRDIYDGLGRLTKTRKGIQAGSKTAGGYYVVEFNGNSVYVHRIIWELANNEEIPKGWIVDHDDGNRSNNAPCNLIAKPFEKNARNCKANTNNTSGFTGVDFYNNGKYDYVRSRWTENGKQRNKCFRADVLGLDRALDLAIQARENAIRIMNTCGAGYTERHGK